MSPGFLGRPVVKLPLSQLTLGRTTPPWYGAAWNTQTCTVVGDVLRVDYPRGSGTGRSHGPAGGCNFKAVPRCLQGTDVTFRYRVRFAPSFQWGKGGKLPGIFVGTGSASGGRHSEDGSSVRVVWKRGGQLVAYVYPPRGVRQPAAYRSAVRRGEEYGDFLFESAGFKALKAPDWNSVILRIKLNGFEDDGRPREDGILTLSVNGQAPATLNGIIWRVRPDILTHHLAIVSFYGGSWTCPRTTHAEFTDFACVA
jgi:hypothetical protein